MADETNGTEKQGKAVTLGGENVRVEAPEDIISLAQRRVDVVDKLISLSLKRTTFRDWMSVENQPYLGHSGAEKVARLFGIKLRNITTAKEWSEDSKGRFYIYRTTGTAELPGGYDSIEALGTCSQRDKFFAWTNGGWRDTVEIDETNVMKASYSNFVVNAITHLLGLRNLTWDDLKTAGIDVEKVQKIEYQAGRERAEKKISAEGKEVRTKLGDMLMRLANNDVAQAAKLLEKYSAWKDDEGKEHKANSLAKMSEKWIRSTYGKVKKDYDKTEAGPREPGQEG